METGISCFRMWSFRPRGGQQMELRKIPDPVVVHAVGGCHINGYPYGPKQSFLNQAFEQVERADVDVRRLAPASFRKINAYFRDPEVPIEGSIVVLQMGNHEAMQRSWRERGGSGGEPWQGDAAASDAPRRLARAIRSLAIVNAMVNLGKLAIFRCRELMGVKFFDAEDFEVKLTELFGALASRNPSQVLVLGAFPANSPEVSVCRRRLNAVMRPATEKFNFTYIDAYAEIDQAKRRTHASLFHDTLHLNEGGAAVVGIALVGPLARSLDKVRAA